MASIIGNVAKHGLFGPRIFGCFKATNLPFPFGRLSVRPHSPCLDRTILTTNFDHQIYPVQINLDLRNCDLRKNLDVRKIVPTTEILVYKLFDLRKKKSPI